LAAGVFTEGEQGASSPVSASRRFDVCIVSPASANTVAKIVCGISDTLVTNIFAQSLKVGRRVIVFPTDFEKNIITSVPSGAKVCLKARDIDLENVRKMGEIEGVFVVNDPKEILDHLK